MAETEESGARTESPVLSTSRATIEERPGTAERLVLAAVLVLSAVLATGVAFVLATGLLGSDAPRTAIERRLLTMENTILESPGDESAHADYAGALIVARQYSTAEQVIARGLELIPDSPAIMLRMAQLARATGDDAGALVAVVEVYTAVERVRTETLADLEERGITGTLTLPGSDELVEASLLEGAIHADSGDIEARVAAYDRALAEDPSMADVLAMRGAALAELGRQVEAHADFEAALEFVPGYEPALAGLASLGGE